MSQNLLETYRKERRALFLMGLALTGSAASAERAILEAFAAAARKRRAEPLELFQTAFQSLAGRPAPESTIDSSLFVAPENPAATADKDRAWRAVDRTLPQDKAILVLRLHSSLATWQIAEALGLSLETATASIRRTLKRLGKRVATGEINRDARRRDGRVDRELRSLPWLQAPESIEEKLRILIRVEQRRGGETPLVFGLAAALALIALTLTAVYLAQGLEDPAPAARAERVAPPTPKPAARPASKPVRLPPPALTPEQRAARARLFAEATRKAKTPAPRASQVKARRPEEAGPRRAPVLRRAPRSTAVTTRLPSARTSGATTWHVAAGFVSKPSSGELTLYLGLSRPACLVTAVMDEGPAARSGLAPFDLILAFDGFAVSDGAELDAALEQAGGQGELTVLRRGRRRVIKLLAKRSLESRGPIAALSAR